MSLLTFRKYSCVFPSAFKTESFAFNNDQSEWPYGTALTRVEPWGRPVREILAADMDFA